MDGWQHSGSEVVRQSRRLIGASQDLVERAKDAIKTAEQRLDYARNAIQVSWLWRTLRTRERVLPNERDRRAQRSDCAID
jgi:hypothetical protein